MGVAGRDERISTAPPEMFALARHERCAKALQTMSGDEIVRHSRRNETARAHRNQIMPDAHVTPHR